jgi:S1-C subfamily serine protease
MVARFHASFTENRGFRATPPCTPPANCAHWALADDQRAMAASPQCCNVVTGRNVTPQRALHWFSICMLLLVTASHAEQPVDLQRLSASVFRIEARDSAARLHAGSGVMVGAQSLVTNCHTIAGARAIQVIGATVRLAAHLARADQERDLCLLDVPGLSGTVATLGSTADKHVGEPLIAVGFPAGASLTVSRGHIEGLFAYRGAGRVVQGSAYFSPGKSGGALFDQQGLLIGILTFKCRAGGPYHFAVPVEWAQALMVGAPHTAVKTAAERPFWQHTGDQQPVFLRVASLFAEGDCKALKALTAQWLEREPDNAEASLMARRALSCDLLAQIQRPQLEK